MQALFFLVADATGQRYASVVLGLDGREIDIPEHPTNGRLEFCYGVRFDDRLDRAVQQLVFSPIQAIGRTKVRIKGIVVVVRCGNRQAREFAVRSIPFRVNIDAPVLAFGSDGSEITQANLTALLTRHELGSLIPLSTLCVDPALLETAVALLAARLANTSEIVITPEQMADIRVAGGSSMVG